MNEWVRYGIGVFMLLVPYFYLKRRLHTSKYYGVLMICYVLGCIFGLGIYKGHESKVFIIFAAAFTVFFCYSVIDALAEFIHENARVEKGNEETKNIP